MSAVLEMVKELSGPVGILVGAFGKSWFDRVVTKATAKNIEAEGVKTEAEGAKIDAEAARIIAATAVSLVEPLKDEIRQLSARVDQLELENEATTGKLRRAVNYIQDLMRFIATHVPDKNPPPLPMGLDI